MKITITLTSVSFDDEEEELEEGDVSPDEVDDLWVVSDDGDDWDDSEEIPIREAEGEVLERVSYYESCGHQVQVLKDGILLNWETL